MLQAYSYRLSDTAFCPFILHGIAEIVSMVLSRWVGSPFLPDAYFYFASTCITAIGFSVYNLNLFPLKNERELLPRHLLVLVNPIASINKAHAFRVRSAFSPCNIVQIQNLPDSEVNNSAKRIIAYLLLVSYFEL
jgi:hypothetical protein